MLLQLWEQWLGPAACCSSSTNSPSPHAAGDEFLQPARARTQRTAASQRQHCTSALHRGTDTPNSHPQPCGGEPFTATSFVSLRHVTLARRCRQLGSVRAEPRQVSHGQCSQPGTATVEQNWSRAVHRQLSHIPNRFGWLSWSPAAIRWQMLQRHPELCDQRQHAPSEHRHSPPLGSSTLLQGKHIWGAEAGREDAPQTAPSLHSLRRRVGKARDVGFGVVK